MDYFIRIGGMNMSSLDYLGGALENFYEGDIENSVTQKLLYTFFDNLSILFCLKKLLLNFKFKIHIILFLKN